LLLAAVAPLTRRSTRVTPTLSAAFTLTATVFDTVPPVGEAIDTVGGVVSGVGAVRAVALVDGAEVFPAASNAVTL
jgi:ferric-dicitrate binding protein FerR (iron transport regulator)